MNKEISLSEDLDTNKCGILFRNRLVAMNASGDYKKMSSCSTKELYLNEALNSKGDCLVLFLNSLLNDWECSKPN
jgi:hypothetical protein